MGSMNQDYPIQGLENIVAVGHIMNHNQECFSKIHLNFCETIIIGVENPCFNVLDNLLTQQSTW